MNDPRGAVDEHGRQRQANCAFVVHTPPGGGQRVAAVRTLRPIPKGEELLVGYGDRLLALPSEQPTAIIEATCAAQQLRPTAAATAAASSSSPYSRVDSAALAASATPAAQPAEGGREHSPDSRDAA